jgi:hypothetical protein
MMCDLGHLSITQKQHEDSIDEHLRKVNNNNEVIVQTEFLINYLEYYKELEDELVDEKVVETNVRTCNRSSRLS